MTTDAEMRNEIRRLSREASKAFNGNDFEKCVRLYNEAYRKSIQFEEESTINICTLNYGAALVNQGKFKLSDERRKDEAERDLRKAVEVLNKVAPVNSTQQYHDIHGDVLFNMGYAFDLLKENNKAIEFYRKAQQEYKKDRNSDQELKCLERCLQLHQQNKQFSEASNVCKEMSKVHKSTNKRLNEADCLCKATLELQKNKAEGDKTIAMAQKCRICLDKLQLSGQDCIEAAKIYNEMGLVLIQLTMFDDGATCFEKALELLHNSGSTIVQLEAVFQQNLGAAYNFLGDYERAIKVHDDAVKVYGKLGSRHGQAQCFMNCAYAYSQLGSLDPNNLEKAELNFQLALQAADDSKDVFMKWQILEGLGAVSWQRGRVEKAQDYFRQALFHAVNKDEAIHARILAKYDLMTQQLRSSRPSSSSMVAPGTLQNGTMLQSIEEQIIVPRNAQKVGAGRPTVRTSQEILSSGQQLAVTPRNITGTGQQMVARVEDNQRQASPKIRGKVPWRKKGSFSNKDIHKVSRGLATPTQSMYGTWDPNSPRFQSSRSLGLAPVESEDSENSEEGSSEDDIEETDEDATEDTEEEDSTDEDDDSDDNDDDNQNVDQEDGRGGRKSGGRTSMSMEKIDAIFTTKRGKHSKKKSALETASHLQLAYADVLREKESQEESNKKGQEPDSDDDDDLIDDSTFDDDEEEETEEETEEEETETEVKRAYSPIKEEDSAAVPRAARYDAPPLPTSSPAQSGRVATADVGTYLEAWDLKYKKSSSNSHATNGAKPDGRDSDNSKSDDEEDGDDNDSTYAQIGNVQSLNREAREETTRKVVEEDTSSESEAEMSKFDQMPRGQRDMILAQKHAEMQAQSPDEHHGDEKVSKSCVIM